MSIQSVIRVFTLAALGVLLSLPATANQLAFPGQAPTKRLLNAQKKAEAAIEAQDYDRAFWFYRKELAPKGDKYGQYMVGYMYENGLGVPASDVRAAAWYQVAAERGHEPIIATSEAFQRSLSPSQRVAARELSETLKAELGDIALLKRDINRDIDRLRDVTGSQSRSGNCDSRPGTVFQTRGIIRQLPLSRYCEILNARIDERVAYIAGYVTFGELELLPDEEDAVEEDAAEE